MDTINKIKDLIQATWTLKIKYLIPTTWTLKIKDHLLTIWTLRIHTDKCQIQIFLSLTETKTTSNLILLIHKIQWECRTILTTAIHTITIHTTTILITLSQWTILIKVLEIKALLCKLLTTMLIVFSTNTIKTDLVNLT